MLKRLAAFLGFLCLVLLLLAFDEGQVERGVDVVRARIEPAVQRWRGRAPVVRPPAPEARGHAVFGAFRPVDAEAAGGELTFEGAVLVFDDAPALRTRPHRIALGRESVVRDLNLPPERQVELREVVPLDARTPPAPSPLCGGKIPGWLAVVREGRSLLLQVWPAGVAPDQPGAVVCGRVAYEGPDR
ncbi:hypothetical protein [Brevundimonas sp.]|jgi:hypothetical protein|uniref:hypothetical protein n=1 Tax=Brevundimonas sp. TaxID=1871086 RepID=UPI002E130974|nr:hypothetical protein [Brevundimonas sp.]